MCIFRGELSPYGNSRAQADHGHPTCVLVTREPDHIPSRSTLFSSRLRTSKCRGASRNFFLESFSVAVFVHGFPEVVNSAFVQAHRFGANNAWDGSKAFFHRHSK